MPKHVVTIKDTHRGLLYEDGVLKRVLEAGSYEVRPPSRWLRRPLVEIDLIDMRERELTIKGQEILTADKVAIRVSIVVRFRVIDPRAARHEVEDHEARLYSDVQLAARRSLASMVLEDILTNRNRLSQDILSEVKESAASYGVNIIRADVKDLVFPGNLQEIMNRVLSAQRLAEAQRIEASAKAEVERIQAEARAAAQKIQTESDADNQQRLAVATAEAQRIRVGSEISDLREREKAAGAWQQHPALMRLMELETLRQLSTNANARIYVRFEPPDEERGSD